MGFDVYVGTFSRFYTRTWENVRQKQARLAGRHYVMLYPGGDPGPVPADQIEVAVKAWKAGINRSLQVHGLGPIEWSEAEAQPYFTNGPGWKGYSALMLWAAYAQRRDQSPPYLAPGDWSEDKVFQEVIAREDAMQSRLILTPTLWLPGDFRYCFDFPALVGEGQVTIASTGALAHQLADLLTQELAWQTRPPLDRLQGDDGSDWPLEFAAHESLEIFLELAANATSHGLPMMLSH